MRARALWEYEAWLCLKMYRLAGWMLDVIATTLVEIPSRQKANARRVQFASGATQAHCGGRRACQSDFACNVNHSDA